MDGLSVAILRGAFQAVIRHTEFVERIQWWMMSPHAAERWFQFELAYELNRAYEHKFIAACEIERADIAMFKPPSKFPLWSNDPIAKLEIKMFGNWCISKHEFKGVAVDISKVDKYPQPSIALVFCTVIGSTCQNPLYGRLMEQMQECNTRTFADVLQRFSENNLDLSLVDTAEMLPQIAGELGLLNFYLLGHANKHALDAGFFDHAEC